LGFGIFVFGIFPFMKAFLTLVFFTVALSLHAKLQFGIQPGLETQFLLSKDTAKSDTLPKAKMPPPKKAAILSACLPGLGQAYNRTLIRPDSSRVKSLWKIPVIYAGFAGLTYGFVWNNGLVMEYRDALRLRYDDDPTTIDALPRYSDNDLVTLKNYYQRYRDLCVIGAAALYTLQILDAAVDAHLSTFDVSKNLSLNIRPAFYPSATGMVSGVGFRLSFR
jgi:hypothetical protein